MSQSAFCGSSPYDREKSDQQASSLSEEINLLKSFLMEPTRALIAGESFTTRWLSGGPW